MGDNNENSITNMKEYTDQSVKPYMAAIKQDQAYYAKLFKDLVNKLNTRLDGVDGRLDSLTSGLSSLTGTVGSLSSKLNQTQTTVTQLESQLSTMFSGMEIRHPVSISAIGASGYYTPNYGTWYAIGVTVTTNVSGGGGEHNPVTTVISTMQLGGPYGPDTKISLGGVSGHEHQTGARTSALLVRIS